MLLILAEALPQPVSTPVRYAPIDYILVFAVFIFITMVVFAIFAQADRRMTKPRIIVTTILLSMFCLIGAIAYLIVTLKHLKENPD